MVKRANFDVAIIGASLAGSTAAYILGRAGLKVALFDKADFPRRKPCGEGLSEYGLGMLKRIGLWIDGKCPPFREYSSYRIHSGNKSVVIPQISGKGITVQRSMLDSKIFESAAAEKSVTPYLNCSVDAVDESGQVCSAGGRYKARYIIAADGSNSKGSRVAGDFDRAASQRIGITATFLGKYCEMPQYIDIEIGDFYETYLTPLADGRLNFTILTSSSSTPNIRKMIVDKKFQSKHFERVAFTGEMELSPIGRTNIGSCRRSDYSGSLLFVGDASETLDPIGGMGMTHAIGSAELAAQAILEIESGTISQTKAFANYSKKRNSLSRPLRNFTFFTYHFLRQSYRFPALLNLATSHFGHTVAKRVYPSAVMSGAVK